LVKLAERITIITYLQHHDHEQKEKFANQTITLYAPLANRLGMGQLKWQLEDLAFRILHPEQYEEISKALKMRRTDRESYVKKIIEKLTTLFKAGGVKDPVISGRAKHIYSIYQKMQNKNLTFKELYDTSAFRILVPSVEDCYTALSLVHAEWIHIPEEFDDYIAKPKPNGYQSIHTVVTALKNINIEIQIRTQEMHEKAELGVASHWKYKEGGEAEEQYEEKINRLRKLMDWHQEIADQDAQSENQNISQNISQSKTQNKNQNKDQKKNQSKSKKNSENEKESQSQTDNVYSKIFEDRIYVFTPKGEVFDLPLNATPLDFAYYIHTEVGHRCKGAKINDVLVPLTHGLKTGDRIDILTAKEAKPSRDWINPSLGYLTTSQAQSKVRAWFKKENYKEDLEAGESRWEKACRREGVKRNEIINVLERFNFKKVDDLKAAIGSGNITAATVLNALRKKEEKSENQDSHDKTNHKPSHRKTTPQTPSRLKNLMIGGVDNLLTQIAKCCKPIPGDNILGYITKGHGISIHHEKCLNIQKAITHRPERIIDVNWGEKTPHAYPVDVAIIAEYRSGLVRDITGLLANENLPLLGLNSRVDKTKNSTYITLTIEINSLELFQKVLLQLRQVASVITAKRA